MAKEMVRGRKLSIPDADIDWRNFEGREGRYNKEGDRSFVVFLDDDKARELEAEGWNIKWPKEDDERDPEEDNRRPYLSVSVEFEKFPAEIYLVYPAQDPEEKPKGLRLDPEEAGMLDWAEFTKVNLVIRPYNWMVNNKSGIKAYLKSGYFHMVVDDFEEEYDLHKTL